jgi:hypothetical protein
VHVFYWSGRLDVYQEYQDPEFFHQGQSEMQQRLGAGDMFGFSLATGHFHDASIDSLAVGVPGEDRGPDGSFISNRGMVHMLRGRPATSRMLRWRVVYEGNGIWLMSTQVARRVRESRAAVPPHR